MTKPARRSAALSFRSPDQCSGCHLPFDARDFHRHLRVLDGQLALCHDCAWVFEHPSERRFA